MFTEQDLLNIMFRHASEVRGQEAEWTIAARNVDNGFAYIETPDFVIYKSRLTTYTVDHIVLYGDGWSVSFSLEDFYWYCNEGKSNYPYYSRPRTVVISDIEHDIQNKLKFDMVKVKMKLRYS